MSRPSKPVGLILTEGKTHLTKSQISVRMSKENELKSNQTYNPNEKVSSIPAALKMFERLQQLYDNIDYIDGLDENIINRYCLLTVETDSMEKMLLRMEDDIDKCEDSERRVIIYKTISGITGNLNRSREMLLKIEDRLFMNPASRAKNVPKKQEKPPETDYDRKFGNV